MLLQLSRDIVLLWNSGPESGAAVSILAYRVLPDDPQDQVL